MKRRAVTFDCAGETCGATLDSARGNTGLLIVSGGNEIRAGAFNGQARLAAEIASAGYPVFRFDRRGVGDSSGANGGFRSSLPDIAAALKAFRKEVPHIETIVGFGNCDAASALMCGATELGFDALILSNPWTIDEGEAHALPPSGVRARYLEKLKNPREIGRLLRGRVNIRKLASGLVNATGKDRTTSSLAGDMERGLAAFDRPVRILLAEKDRTAQVFAQRWDPQDPRISRCQYAGHAYVEPHARAWLREQILAGLANA